jgi:hypothetical protein
MEADIASMEERKEGYSGALISVGKHADDGPSDSSQQIDRGQ